MLKIPTKKEIAENNVSISAGELLDNAISKILNGEKNVTFYLSEKVARRIADAFMEEKTEAGDTHIVDPNSGDLLSTVSIEIMYED